MPAIYLKPTQGGFEYFEAVSALQKFCRRGMVDEAIFIATELSLSGYHEACWKRLFVIAVEDVGSGNPNLIVELQALYSTFKHLSKKDDPQHLCIIEAVLRICESEKTRRSDNIYGVFIEHRHRLPPFVIPDWTKGMFTSYGKKKKRSNLYFYLVEGLVHPASAHVDRWLAIAQGFFLKRGETIGAPPEDLPEEQPWSSDMPSDVIWPSETPVAKSTAAASDSTKQGTLLPTDDVTF